IGHQPVAVVNHDMVCEVLNQSGGKDDPRTLWLRHPPLADFVRRILADILDFAAASEYRSRDLANPANWDRLQYLYPAVGDIHTTKHFAAIEPEDAPVADGEAQGGLPDLSEGACFRAVHWRAPIRRVRRRARALRAAEVEASRPAQPQLGCAH